MIIGMTTVEKLTTYELEEIRAAHEKCPQFDPVVRLLGHIDALNAEKTDRG